MNSIVKRLRDRAMFKDELEYEAADMIEQQAERIKELEQQRDAYKDVAEAHSSAFQECIKLREQRDELLAALEQVTEQLEIVTSMGRVRDERLALINARAAIAKVIGEMK